ncbi:MAG: UDP-N-acetylmuramoyl-tripeptide--D-alanyl-D-alanine ligase [Gammaproteobacteria bacterium]|nr:UDP-N-acetylmuramoyl-tripeptide--D-alanyl-D-alanine ligase [Gammaproteobacteria bacterium]
MMISEVASIFNTKFSGEDKKFNSVSIDSRTLNPGDLFIALKGENFDGHEYLQLASEKGAVAAIVDRKIEADLPVIVVQDTKLALGRLATYWRQKLQLKIIGLTGSNGKTTVKEMLVCIFSELGSVTATAGNFNNDIGLPLTLLKMKPEHEFAVVEMGANHIGEIEYLTKLTRPDVALLNNAAPAHLEGFGSMQGVADAKGEIFSGLSNNGIAVINLDDKFADYWISLCDDHKKIFFGLDAAADVTSPVNADEYDGMFILQTAAGDIEITLNVLGLHNLKNALAASAVAVAFGVDLNVIKAGLEKFKGVKGRLQVNKMKNDSVVIDDSYNANPGSVKAAIDVLSQQQPRTILVLGDMGELGDNAGKLHAELGVYAREKEINCLMTYGEYSMFAAKSFGENGFSYANKQDLINDLKLELNEKVAVLVKGSRSVHMEDVVAELIDNNPGAVSCC